MNDAECGRQVVTSFLPLLVMSNPFTIPYDQADNHVLSLMNERKTMFGLDDLKGESPEMVDMDGLDSFQANLYMQMKTQALNHVEGENRS